MAKKNISDDDREQYVMNDEYFYSLQKQSGVKLRVFVKQNRKQIDEAINKEEVYSDE